MYNRTIYILQKSQSLNVLSHSTKIKGPKIAMVIYDTAQVIKIKTKQNLSLWKIKVLIRMFEQRLIRTTHELRK